MNIHVEATQVVLRVLDPEVGPQHYDGHKLRTSYLLCQHNTTGSVMQSRSESSASYLCEPCIAQALFAILCW